MTRSAFTFLAFGLATLSMAGHAKADTRGAVSWHQDLVAAMEMAQNKNTDGALVVLQRLHRQHSDDAEVSQDYIAVLDQGQHSEEVIAYYQTQKDAEQPEYLLLAAAHAYDRNGQPEQAIAIYRRGSELYPKNSEFVTGTVQGLFKQGRAGDVFDMSPKLMAMINTHDTQSMVQQAHHEHAVQLARAGNYIAALKELSNLHTDYPDDVAIAQDYVAVQAWSGADQVAVDTYHTLPTGTQPDYVYAAVGLSLRNLHQPTAASALYHEALAAYPTREDFKIGEVRSLVVNPHY